MALLWPIPLFVIITSFANHRRIRVNDVHDSAFTYNDPTMEICQDEAKAKQRNLDYFSQAHLSAVSAVDGSLGYGEVSICQRSVHAGEVDLNGNRIY